MEHQEIMNEKRDGIALIIFITCYEPICTQLLTNHTVWRRRKRHIWHYSMLFAANYKNIMTWANNIGGQIENEMTPNM